MEQLLTDEERTAWVRARVAVGTADDAIAALRSTLWTDDDIDMAIALGG